MKRASMSIFAVLSLLLTQLQPIVFAQTSRVPLPANHTTRPNEPALPRDDKQAPPGDQTAQTSSPKDRTAQAGLQAGSSAHSTSRGYPPAQTAPADPAAEKVRHGVEKTGMAQKITVFLKNGDALHGAVTKIDRDEFAIAEVDFQRIFTIQYKDVKKTRSGYGEINLLTGKRVSPPKAAKIAVHVGLLFLIIGLPTIILATTKD